WARSLARRWAEQPALERSSAPRSARAPVRSTAPRAGPAMPTSRPINSSPRSRCRAARRGTISPSAATSSFPRALTARSNFCWSTRRPATPRSSAARGSETRARRRLLLLRGAGGEFVERLVDEVALGGITIVELALAPRHPFGKRDHRGFLEVGNCERGGDFAKRRPQLVG